MSEINLVPIKENKFSSKKLTSSKKSGKNKKLKGKKKLIDISNKITLEFKYEDFEQETDSFFPKIYREEKNIIMDNAHLLDQSHLRFLINPNSDIINQYNSYKKKNFKNISWKDIELIFFNCNKNYVCPICLELKLCCPVITKCGHVFCYPCIISLCNYYTNFGENKYSYNIPKCPLCKEKLEMNLDDECFKLCKIIENNNYNVDMNIKFNLILRNQKSQTLYNLVYDPLLTNWENNFRYKMRDIPEINMKEFNFSRLFLANEQLMNKILNEYKSDLIQLKKEFEFTSDELKKSSINQCINKIESLILKCKYENKQNEENEDKFPQANKKNINEENNSEDDIKVDIDYKQYCLFYQEEKGDIFYLDPLIMEILLYEYGDYNSLPTEIEGKIVDISMTQVTPEFKSNYKYLNHLRLGSVIYFVEIDINDLISSSTEKKFHAQLEERNRMRKLLKNQEKSYELFLIKKNSKISEEEKDLELNSTMGDSKKSLVNNFGSLFFETDEELKEKEDEKEEIEEKENNQIKSENKLTLLLLEKEKEEKENKEKEENEKDLKKLKKNINEKGGKNKKKNIKGGKKNGKKGKKNDIKEMVFNSESCSESDN